MKSTQRIEIISAYGNILENRRLIVGRESDLPFPKELIRQALAEELVNPSRPELLNALEIAFLELESFLTDEEFELVSQFLKAVAEGAPLLEKGDIDLAQKAAALIADTPREAIEIQGKIARQQEERLRQVENMRELRK